MNNGVHVFKGLIFLARIIISIILRRNLQINRNINARMTKKHLQGNNWRENSLVIFISIIVHTRIDFQEDLESNRTSAMSTTCWSPFRRLSGFESRSVEGPSSHREYEPKNYFYVQHQYLKTKLILWKLSFIYRSWS